MIRTTYLAFFLLLILIGRAPAQDTINFEKQIKPILAENCFACHGIDAAARAADLRLDVRDSAVDYGAIVPEDSDSSSLIERIFESDSDLVMPPVDSNKKLTAAEKELLKKWVDQGAAYQQHWSLIAPTRPVVPSVRNESWPRNAIDRFVLAQLEQAGLSPAVEADPRTLFRRLSLDISGLPPQAEEVELFVNDYQRDSEKALSDWIDKLMARSTWGEHRARYWLDAARYADTHGMHFDNYREMWPYRDWVIRSFNANQRFDQFTIEQLAGDLLENPTQDQLIATGFQRCNMTTNEGGTIDEENLAIYAADRVQTFGWVYLGLTTNCAQCHDHKFDPISMKDYYSLAAFFRNTTQKPKDGNRKDGLGPTIMVPTEQDAARWKALPDEIAAANRSRNQKRNLAKPEFEKWLASIESKDVAKTPTSGLILHVPLNEGKGDSVKNKLYTTNASAIGEDKNAEQSFNSSGKLNWNKQGIIGPAPKIGRNSTIELGDYGNFAANQAYSVGCWVKTNRNSSGAIIGRMDNSRMYRGWDVWVQGKEFAAHLIDSWTGNALKIATVGNQVKHNQWQHVMVTWDGSESAQGLKIFVDGKAAKIRFEMNTLKKGANTQINTPLHIGCRKKGDAVFNGFVQDFLLYDRQLNATEISNIANSGPIRLAIDTPKEKRTAEITNSLLNHYLINHNKDYIAADKKLNDLKTEQSAIRARSPITHVQVEKQTPAMAHILMRGAYDKPGAKVNAAPPSSLHAMPNNAPANRLGLARWVVDPANPLTARVTVNRFWQELFGHGIVATSEDFGVMGTAPTHPELLDWLAIEFRDSGWNVKRFYKLMFMSATYRQAAVITKEKLLKDRDNSLLSRGPRFRMDAEMIRDYALAASGQINLKMYGPGTRPYQPDNLWNIVGLPGGDTRNYRQDMGEKVYRRSLYNFWKRMSPPPNLETFNAPNREVCTVRRDRTNTPLQALVTLNDPQFFEAARVLAQNALNHGKDNHRDILDYVAGKTVCRPLREIEIQIIQENLNDFLKHYQAQPEEAKKLIAFGQAAVDEKLDPSQLAAWTMVCNQMLNLDEVLNK